MSDYCQREIQVFYSAFYVQMSYIGVLTLDARYRILDAGRSEAEIPIYREYSIQDARYGMYYVRNYIVVGREFSEIGIVDNLEKSKILY